MVVELNQFLTQRGLYSLSIELASFSIWISLLTELSKPALLAFQTYIKTQNKGVCRWMSHPKHRITYSRDKISYVVKNSAWWGLYILFYISTEFVKLNTCLNMCRSIEFLLGIPWGLYHKTHYGRNLRISIISQLFVPCKPFQPSLVLAGKSGAYLSEAPFRCSLNGRLQALPTKTRLGWKGLPGTNTLANYGNL